jgi:hypothetical protein
VRERLCPRLIVLSRFPLSTSSWARSKADEEARHPISVQKLMSPVGVRKPITGLKGNPFYLSALLTNEV